MRRLGGLFNRRRRFAAWPVAAGLVMLIAVSVPAAARSQAQDTLAGAGTKPDTTAAAKSAAPPKADAAAHAKIRITVEKRGEIVVELIPDQAPKACERILALVESGFYDGLRFHRVESYLVQAGARESTLAPVEGEMFSQRLSHEAGMVGMARLPDNYDSATTQFYIMKEHRPLLNAEYTLFGRVVEGMDVVRAIKKGDVIKSIAVLRTP